MYSDILTLLLLPILAAWVILFCIGLPSKIKPKWEVRRTIWPYEDGWGTYCPKTSMLLDTGLSKEEAEHRCAILNRDRDDGDSIAHS